jgi:putative DNA primase/helicase
VTYAAGRLTPTTASDDAVAQALAYAAGGVPVFPVFGTVLRDGAWGCACGRGPAPDHNEGKHPATPHGHNDTVLVDEAQAEAWFRDGTRNLAVPGGSGIVYVDVDPRHDGYATLDDWESWTSGTSLPRTLELQTGGGGLHLYYHVPAGARIVSRNGVLPGVDIKSDGGYVVGATARHASGGLYRWVDPEVPVATVPADLLTWMVTRRGGSGASGVETPDGYDFHAGGLAGQRDAYANDVAFRLRKSGVSWDRARRAMRDAWEGMEQPPGDPFPWEMAEDKLRRVWENVPPDDVAQHRMWWPGVTDAALPTAAPPAIGDVDGDRPLPPPVVLEGVVVGGRPREPEHATDLGNSLRFARLLSDRVRYVPDEGRWYVWDGSVLGPDRMNSVMEMTKLVLADLRDEVLTMREGQDRDRMVAWALVSEGLARREACVRGAQGEQSVAVPASALDADPLLLVVDNGTLDLRTGRLRESRLADLCTRKADVRFDPDAECPLWRAHVEMVTAGSADLAAYLQRAAGYTLTGLVSEQKFFFLWGTGQNGKNVFTETLRDMLGGYAKTAPAGLLTGDGEHPTILAGLRGMRLVLSDETSQNVRLNDSRVKMLTGSGKISARFMGKDFFEFDASAKLWVLGNAKPVIKDTSDGMWRRMQLVPFTATVSAERRILGYEKVLREEWPGILNWCLEGLAAWQELGAVGAPAAVTEAVSKYRDEEDHVGQFLTQMTVTEEGAFTANASLYMSYQMWCALQGLDKREVHNQVHLGREVSARGFVKDMRKVLGKVTRGTVGLRLLGDQ